MASINSFTFSGNLGRDPELRFFESGTAVATISVAITPRKSDDPTIWMPVKIWGKQAQVAGDFLRKGSKVGITGVLQQEEWDDRSTGEKRSRIYVNCQSMTMLDKAKEEDAPF